MLPCQRAGIDRMEGEGLGHQELVHVEVWGAGAGAEVALQQSKRQRATAESGTAHGAAEV